MTIVGSTYIEKCLYPYWNELYGSGWRAACALSDHTEDIDFYTYLDKEDKKNLQLFPTYNIIKTVETVDIDQTIVFDYFHGLSEPKIYPPINMITQNKTIEVSDSVVLRYGFLEGDAKVKGERVIYDPQSATNPKDFYENGSEADELVLVLNFREAYLMTGERDIQEISKKLLQKNTVGIILKEGPAGGKIITEKNIDSFSAYQTNFVFPIGSGDIFAAFIAYYWGKEEKGLTEAATLASKAVAAYCESQVLPIKKGYESKQFIPIKNPLASRAPTVYLAGPFFNMHQRWLIEEARNNLISKSFKVFSPIHDVGRGVAEDVVPADIQGIHDSDIIFAILDGLDSGTVFEVGFAIALGKKVVVYVVDETEEDLKMLEGTGCYIVRDFVSAIYKTKWLSLESV